MSKLNKIESIFYAAIHENSLLKAEKDIRLNFNLLSM